MHGQRTTSVERKRVGSGTARRGGTGPGGPVVLTMPADTRKRLTALYRARDEADAARHASGEQRGRSSIWATCVRRLELGQEVYETYRVLAAAGVEMPAETASLLAGLPNDWQQICHIDESGVVRTASVKARVRSGR
ncbi:MAG: hypothetical protein D9V44_05000 [Actinobacteria bacterium]|nr:MAG: hypothetical protein D9V44_05000 [Actinomycetota bacterium]